METIVGMTAIAVGIMLGLAAVGAAIGMAANGLNLALMETFTQMLGRLVIFVMMDSQKTTDMHQLSSYMMSLGKQ